ncbi:hypothetical protein [Rhodococcus tibetensis]|uniref:DRTGG domain-containing protein n=1 Tax=Rhodococcus tibetensis TaxID=2965064 RepID=A0ABT1QAQ5_9NOCA|nr:hypothetical protein [Rhodococcus sp. FXJ9.536]MCQ4119343.1 hypothetical protein [Rhodococcus sp. FXJ9.536]
MDALHGVRTLLFVGKPEAGTELNRWLELKRWASGRGIASITSCEGDVLCAIATEDVLDGLCTPSDAMVMQQARARRVPCVSVRNARLLEDAL